MKYKTLLLLVMISFVTASQAQKNQKQKEPSTGYAITASEKGGSSWNEVRLVNVTTGEELKTIYKKTDEVQPLNARTNKPIAKKEVDNGTTTYTVRSSTSTTPNSRKVVDLDDELAKANGTSRVTVKSVIVVRHRVSDNKPFSTHSAAMAYDKKHDRLYYTPMGINQLRYIDLKSGKIYYFEDEPFGLVKGYGDVNNQITRMVIASDGNGYALTNDGNHLIRFTTGKNPVITDLGALSDDANNGKSSIHTPGWYGGDIVADANENLYLIDAFRHVFKISINSKVATYLGSIKGLPAGFTTNGAMVDEGSKVIVASSRSTDGYYLFDLTTLEAEKVSQQGNVYNAADLANGNLAFDKKKKKKKNKEEIPAEEQPKVITDEVAKKAPSAEDVVKNGGIGVFPNPVTDRNIKVSFSDQPPGKYQIQLLDLSGKLIRSQEINIGSKVQVADFTLPEVAKGNYLIKVVSASNNVSVTNKIVVQ